MAKRNVALCELAVQGVPHKHYSKRLILAVEEAVRQAWEGVLRKVPPEQLYEAGEIQISNELRNQLMELWRSANVTAFSERDFGPVIKAGELESYDGQHIELRPDLVFYRKRRPPGITLVLYDGIFAECKIIDENKKIGDYVIDGIEEKFLNGQYAWAMSHAMMIAYVRNRREPLAELTDYFDLHDGGNRIRFQVVTNPPAEYCKLSTRNPLVVVTRHARTWLHRNGAAAGDIELRHLWLQELEMPPQ